LIEVLIAITLGTILIITAVSAIVPALTVNRNIVPIQTGTALGAELIDNVRVWSEGDWHNILALATGTANQYYINTGVSSYAAATGTEVITPNSVSAGLVGWWKFDEGTGTIAYDSSGNANNGGWQGATAYAAGKVGLYAGSFNGASYVDAGNQTSLNTPNITVVAWIYPTSLNSYQVIASKLYAGYTLGWELSNSSGVARVTLRATTTDMYFNGSLNVNTWQMVAFTYDGATLKGYLNGALNTAHVATSTNLVSTADFQIGTRFGGSNLFNGFIDDVHVYNKALSAAEINQLYTMPTYMRYFYVSDVYRSSGNIVSSGGTYDPSTKLVTVVYTLPTGVTSSMSTYLTRHGDMVYDQTDWSGGPGVNGSTTALGSTFSTSSNIDYSTTTGSVYIAIPGY